MLAAVDFVVVLVLVVVAEGLVVVGVLVEALVLVVDTEDLVVVVVRTDELVLVVLVVIVEDFVVVWLVVDVGADEALLRDGVAAQVDTLSPLAKLESPAGCKA